MLCRLAAMTITVPPARRRRIDAGSVHAYSMPVVRELPSQPADPARDLTW
jgi:hypothetical protein